MAGRQPETRPEGYPKLENYEPTRFMLPTSHYDKEKADRAVKFIEMLCHTKGEWAGKRFWLLPWQERLVRDVIGVVKEDGTRQFRTAFVEICKKVGKSELAAAIALYLLYADNEPSAEVYGAASDRSQASIVFDTAKRMVELNPALLKRSKIMAATKRLVNYSNAGFYQVLSAEVGCVTPETLMQMEDGTLRRADEVKPGDVVLSFDGLAPVFDRIISAREEEPSETIEITTHHGRKTTVSANHPFYRMEPGRRMQDLTHVYDWEQASFLHVNDRLAVSLGWPTGWKPPEDVISPLEAWALGAWMGDGDCTHFRFINPDREVIDKLSHFFESIGSGMKSVYSTRQKQEGKDLYQDPVEHLVMGVGKRRKSPGREWIREHFGQDSKCYTKTVPDAVLRGGREAWSAFLAGYMDTDGCVTKQDPKGKGQAFICSVSADAIEQVRVLLARLGINASTRSEFKVTVSGIPQLRKLWEALSPYMVQPSKRRRLEKLAGREIRCLQRASESDKVWKAEPAGMRKTISFEMERFQTHCTDGLITHNTKHGLNVSGLVFDEIHALPNRELYDVLTKGASDARRNPLAFIITTAGNNRDSIGYELHTKAKDILAGKRSDPSFYPVVYSLDMDEDWTDERNWYKVNPSLGYTVKIDRMRDAFNEALQNPADEVTFRWLRLNQWVGSSVAWIPDSIVAKGDEPIDMPSLYGRDCYAGLDLSSSEDITAMALMFPPRTENEKYILLFRFWVPEETIPRRVRQTGYPYDAWKARGYLDSTPGNVIDYAYIEKAIGEMSQSYHICEIAFDRWGSNMLVERLTEMGMTVVPFGQGYSSMSAPSKEFYEQMMKGNILHGGNPVFRWMCGNVVIDVDPAGNIKPTKKRSNGKIDGVVAAIMALDRCVRHEQQGSVYDERGLYVF